jgi:predicted DNA-binding transcriptional regulator YafY
MPRRRKQPAGRRRALVRVLTLISLLKRTRPLALRQLARKLGVSERTIQRDLKILPQVGLRVRHESRKNGRRVFWLPRTKRTSFL